MMTRSPIGRCLATVMLAAVAVAGCAKKSSSYDQAEAVPAAADAPVTQLVQRGKGEESEEKRLNADTGGIERKISSRKLIQTGEMQLEVSKYADARAAIDNELKRVGGFVADADVQHHDGRVSRATLTLRIPQAHFHSFLRGAAERGTVLREQLHSADVTGAYVDTAARLKNAQRLESRIVELLNNKTDGVKDLLEVERELARVREQIERYQGQIKQYDDKVGLSTLKLELIARQTYVASTPQGLGERVSNTFASSLNALGLFGRGALLLVVALAPWLLPLLLLGWLGFRGVRWLAKKGRLAREAGQSSGASGHGAAAAAAGVVAGVDPLAPNP